MAKLVNICVAVVAFVLVVSAVEATYNFDTVFYSKSVGPDQFRASYPKGAKPKMNDQVTFTIDLYDASGKMVGITSSVRTVAMVNADGTYLVIRTPVWKIGTSTISGLGYSTTILRDDGFLALAPGMSEAIALAGGTGMYRGIVGEIVSTRLAKPDSMGFSYKWQFIWKKV